MQFNLKKSKQKNRFFLSFFPVPKIALRERQNFVFNIVFQITRKIFKRKNKIMKNLKRIFFRFAETVVKEEKSVTKKKNIKTTNE